MRTFLAGLMMLAWIGSAQAKLVSQEFTGVLLNNTGLSQAFNNEFPAGTKWKVLVEWDDEQQALYMGDTQSQWATTKMTLSFQGKSGTWTSSAANSGGTFSLNQYATIDEIQFTSGWGPDAHTNPTLADYPLYSFNLVFTHSMGEAIDGVAQVPSQIDLSKWMLSISELKIYVNNNAFPVIKGSIDGNVTPPDEVAKMAVFSSGKKLRSGLSTVSLGDAVVGGIAQSRSLVIQNNGTAAIKGMKAVVRGKHRGDFIVRNLPTGALAPGEKARIKILFKAKNTGVRRAKLELQSNDPKSPFVIYLRGSGIEG